MNPEQRPGANSERLIPQEPVSERAQHTAAFFDSASKVAETDAGDAVAGRAAWDAVAS